MAEQLTETIEDLQFRALRRTKIFDPLAVGNFKESKRWIAVSSRYGICVLVGPQNKIYSCFCSHIHKLETHSTGDSDITDIRFRSLDYHNSKAHISSVSVNCDGSVIAFATNTPNGPFVDIFDIVTFTPTVPNQKLFPVATIRLSSENSSKFVEMQWNPVDPEVFVALASDNTLNTFKYSLQMGSAFSLLGSLNVRATCLCWSPKGKQLAIGDASGRVHQLKPDLSSVRVIDPPAQIPIFVKKQQPPKWTHFGDVLSLSRKSLTFCPLLEWQMVFVLSAESPSVVVFGLRGDKWLKFEFDTFDIEMPLTANNKDTFPLGIALDFSSTTPIPIGEGSDKSVRNAPPFVHFLNSSGSLLPYAVLSLNNERPLLTKAPEQIEMKNAKFGKSPMGENSAEKTATDQQSKDESTQANSMPTKNIVTMQREEEHTRGVNRIEEKTVGKEENGEKEKMEMKLRSERDKIAALERALEKSVTEYTAKRNDQTERIAQLGQLRREAEKSASPLDTGFLVELHNIKTDLLHSFRQSLSSLDRLCVETNDKMEFLNSLKLAALREGETSVGLNKPSFDMERRIHLIEREYENIMEKMKKARKLMDRFEGCRKKQIPRTSEDTTIGPIEQRKIIQINENIAKMSARLNSRLHQIRRSVGRKSASSATDAKKLTQISVPLVDFCALELEKLKLPTVGNGRPHLVIRETKSDLQQLQINLRDYLMKRPKEVEVKRIFSLKMPDESETVQKVPMQSVADQKLARRISAAASSPPKPQLVSVGVQSPDFAAQSREKTPKRAPLKKTSTPKAAKNGGQSLRNAVPISSTPLSFSTLSPKPTEAISKETPIVEKVPGKVPMPLATLPTEKAIPSPPETVAILSQSQATEKGLMGGEEGTEKQRESQPTEESAGKANVAEEGMDDEAADAAREAVTSDFMKSGLGSSTPIGANRNPFGSIALAQGSGTSGRSLFGTPPTSFGTPSGSASFGTPSSKPTFGSLAVSPSAASPFGASPFSSPSAPKSSFGGGFAGGAAAPSAFGGGASFGSVSPFSSLNPPSGGFGASPFGGGTTSGGKSMFGGGIGAGGAAPAPLSSGFSAFANKSAGFGQLAGQQSPPSLFGGGPPSADTSFNQPKTSAFMTFRK
ncbi:hypothetical protein niasHT_003747 [Heterodera trifolii]|uniref:Nuclear pore complex protein n=1 Tax=Heterodera trifolii TaxID=157864 RepID=A0ABD2LUT5_9BILA